jgi:hypothetical protein
MTLKTLNAAVAAMQGADGCEDCFRMGLGLARSLCDAPQPRWIGKRYFATSPRVAVVLINPGGGGPSADPALAREADLFRDFHRTGDYERVRDYFTAAISRGDRWLSWYRDTFGLNHDEIAQLNIAWALRVRTAIQGRCFGTVSTSTRPACCAPSNPTSSCYQGTQRIGLPPTSSVCSHEPRWCRRCTTRIGSRTPTSWRRRDV